MQACLLLGPSEYSECHNAQYTNHYDPVVEVTEPVMEIANKPELEISPTHAAKLLDSRCLRVLSQC
jgi:hypothetical protein